MIRIFKKQGTAEPDDLRKILGDYELPSFPEVVMNVLALLRDPDSSTAEIAGHLEMDPGMHVKVLKTVNSALYGLSSQVSSVLHAINLLGRARLESLVVAFAVHAVTPSVDERAFDVSEFWRAAAARASLARALAHHLHPATQAETFTVGLLQDLAVPLLAAAKGQEYSDVYDQWLGGGYDRLDVVERMAFGFDHAQLGGLVAGRWGLPEYLTETIRVHHERSDCEEYPAVYLVANLRKGTQEDALEAVAETCAARHDLAADRLLGEMGKALGEAEEFYRLLR